MFGPSPTATSTLPLLATPTPTRTTDHPPPPADADAAAADDNDDDDDPTDGSAQHLDSLSMLTRAGASMSGQDAARLHMYAVVTILIVYSHFSRACGAAMYDTHDAQSALDASMATVSLHYLTLFPALCVITGVEDRRHGWSWARLRHGLLLNAALVWLLRFSPLPAAATELQLRFWRFDPWLDGSAGMAEQLWREHEAAGGGTLRHAGCTLQACLASFQAAQISWWPVTLSCWRIVGHIGARRLRLPAWLLPACAVVLHFAKGWAQRDGQSLLAPVAAVGLRADYWVFYAAVPPLLPRRFPLDLPLGAWLQRRAAAVRALLARRHEGGGAPLGELGGRPPRWVVHAPRVFWVLAAAACYAAGSYLARAADEHHHHHHHHDHPHNGKGGGSPWDWAPLLRLYADAARSGGGSGLAAAPSYHLLMLDTPPRRHAYGSFPGLRAHVHRVGAAVAARHLVVLHVGSLVYALVLVVALAAVVPRRRVAGLTTAGAGSLAVYATQGFLAPPLLLGPARQAMLRWWHAPMHVTTAAAAAAMATTAAGGGGGGGAATGSAIAPDAVARTNLMITALVLAQCVVYTVVVASAAAAVAACCTAPRGGGVGARRRRWWCATLLGAAVAVAVMVAMVQRGLPGSEALPSAAAG